MAEVPGRKTPRPKEPYGGATVEERAAAMRGDMTDEEIAARNVIPETAPNGDPHRVIAEEYYSENDTFTHFKPAHGEDPGPAAFAPVKPGILREGKKITDRIPIKLGIEKMTVNEPDYWGLASVMTEEEAELTKHMKVRVPETFEQVVAGSGMKPERVQELLDAMSIKGIIEYNWENEDGKNPERRKRYVLPMFVPGSAEFTVMNQKQLEEHPEIGTFFNRMTYLPLTVATKMVPPGGAGIGMHVIPVEHAIRQENVALGSEDFKLFQRLRERRRRDVDEWFVVLDKAVAMGDWGKARSQARWIMSHATLNGERPDVRRAADILATKIPAEESDNND